MRIFGTAITLFLLNSLLYLQAQSVLFERTAFQAEDSTANNTMDVESADMDGDGDLDLILASEFVRNLYISNLGNLAYSANNYNRFNGVGYKQFSGQDSEDIAIADFDQDGFLDVLFVSEDSPGHELFFNRGNATFELSTYRFPASVANALAVTDLNGDDYPDVIIGNNGQNQVFINQKNKYFSEATSSYFPDNDDATQDLKLIDIDLDGDLDLVEGIERGGNNIYIFDSNRFLAANDRLPNFGTAVETRKVAVGDINDDGYPDLFYCNVSWRPGVDPQDRLLVNDGKGFFRDITATALPANPFPTLDANIVDYNRDGFADILTVGSGPEGKNYSLYINDGQGKFTDQTSTLLPAMKFRIGISLHTADLNADGFLDIYIGCFMGKDQLYLGLE